MALELTFGSDEWCDDVINSSGRVALVANATSKVVFCDGAAVHSEAGGTGGADGLAEKAAATFEPDDLEGEISAVAVRADGAVVVGDDAGVVRVYDGAGSSTGRELLTGAGRVLRLAANGDLGAFCFEDKVVVKKLDGTGDALAIDAAGASAAWDPLAPNRLATLDATLRLSLFDVSMGTGVDEANRVAECGLGGAASASQDFGDAAKTYRFAWQPGAAASWLAAPGRPELTLLPRTPAGADWAAEAQGVFCDDDQATLFKAPLVACCWNSAGTLCAAVSAERNVSVWDVATGAPILIYGCDLAIKAFAFCSSGGAESLVLASADGALAVAGVVGADEEEEDDEEEDASPRKRLIEDAAGEISDEEDLVDMMPQPSRKKKKKVQVDSDDDLSLSPLEANEPTDDVIVGDRDLDEPAPMDEESFADDGAEPDADPFAAHAVAAPPPTVPFQPPFMVSSTVAEEETAARFLHWSHRGSVTARAEEGGLEFAFEVEHYAEGAARGRVVRFVDRRDFTLGTLGARGAFFATGGDELDESQLYFRPLSSWASDGGWSAKLPPGEFATTLAAGDDWVAATTSRDLLRIYSGGGVEDAVVGGLGRAVACCAHKRSLAVAYHRSSPTADGQQDVWIQVLDVEGRSAVNGDGTRLPLPPGSKLAWLGFKTDDGVLLAKDSSGSFWMLVDDFGWRFAPALDAAAKRVNAGDREWPVFAVHGFVHCALLKGGAPYPPCRGAKPVLERLALRQPHASAAWDAAAREAEAAIGAPTALARQRARAAGARDALGRLHAPTAADADRDALDADALAKAATDAILQRDRAVLRQLVAAAKQQLYLRAFDLARRLELPESLDLALRIANSHGEEALTSRVEDLVAFRNELDTHAVADHPAARPPSPAYDAPAEAYEPEPDAPPVADENDEAPLGRRSSNAPSPVEGAPPAKAAPAPFTNPFKIGGGVGAIDSLRF